ncbi:hypothetical protein, partial [Mangrovimonas sp. ST2L15]|uniref:hypothetical protein n=2 Tax=Mangrovimonas sp. ST2L15 TaxID=1645916 RepID=UPI000AEC5C6E
TSVDLTALEPGGQTGGSWTYGGGTAVSDATDADPANAPFTYTYTDGNGCDASDTVGYSNYTVTPVSIDDQMVCPGTTSVDLTALEPGGQTGGSWTYGGGTAVSDATDADPANAPFTYTYTDGNG